MQNYELLVSNIFLIKNYKCVHFFKIGNHWFLICKIKKRKQVKLNVPFPLIFLLFNQWNLHIQYLYCLSLILLPSTSEPFNRNNFVLSKSNMSPLRFFSGFESPVEPNNAGTNSFICDFFKICFVLLQIKKKS